MSPKTIALYIELLEIYLFKRSSSFFFKKHVFYFVPMTTDEWWISSENVGGWWCGWWVYGGWWVYRSIIVSKLTWGASCFGENSTVKLQIFILRTLLTKLDFYGIVSEGASDLEGFKVGRLQWLPASGGGLVLVFGRNRIVCRSDRTHCLEWISLHVVKTK